MDLKENKITVLGSASKDFFFLVDRCPALGETIQANGFVTACGGKGANQAAGVGKLGYKVDFIGQVGKDLNGNEILSELISYGVNVEHTKQLENVPTGQAYILSYPNKDNSIIIVGGSNMNWSGNDLEGLKSSLKTSKFLLLQREIPDDVNIQACKIAKEYGVKVIFDVGGADKPMPMELLRYIDILSPNETELRRISNKDIDINSDESIIESLHHVRNATDNNTMCLLLKLGSKGSTFYDQHDKCYKQSVFNFEDMPIVDTTGAGDCFTASFATQLMEDKSITESLKFATVCAYICITKFGAMPSLPDREEVEKLFQRI